MWFEIVNWLGMAYNAYRAFQDSGGWFVHMNGHIFNNYMESFMVERGLL